MSASLNLWYIKNLSEFKTHHASWRSNLWALHGSAPGSRPPLGHILPAIWAEIVATAAGEHGSDLAVHMSYMQHVTYIYIYTNCQYMIYIDIHIYICMTTYAQLYMVKRGYVPWVICSFCHFSIFIFCDLNSTLCLLQRWNLRLAVVSANKYAFFNFHWYLHNFMALYGFDSPWLLFAQK